MPLTATPGSNIVTTDKGVQVYSRMTQDEYNRSKESEQQDQSKPKTIPNYIPDKPYYTNDQFKAQRENAFATGRFDYGAVKSSFYTPPDTYTNKAGATVTREPSLSTQTESADEHSRQQALSQARLEEDRQQVEQLTNTRESNPTTKKESTEFKSTVPTISDTFVVPPNHPVNDLTSQKNSVTVSEGELARSNSLRASLGLPPLESVVPVNELIYPKGNPVTVSEGELARSNSLRASLGLPPLESVVPVNVVTYTKQPIVTREVTSKLTTQNYKEDVLSLLARPILEMGAAIGVPLIEAIKGNIAESPLAAFLKGEQNDPLTPVYTKGTQEKIEAPFGVSEEVSKITTGEYGNVEKVAALSGVVVSVAIPTVAGLSGIGKVPELETLSNKLTGKSVSSITEKVTPAFKENTLEVTTEKQGQTTILTQGTEQKISLTELKVEKATPFYEASQKHAVTEMVAGQKVEELKPVTTSEYKKVEPSSPLLLSNPVNPSEPNIPIEIPSTKFIETIGQIGTKTIPHEPTIEEIAQRYPLMGKGNNDLSDLTKGEPYIQPPEFDEIPIFGKVVKEVPNVINIKEQSVKSGTAEISLAAITEKQIAYTRSPSSLEESKFIVSNPSKELISTFGLKKIPNTKNDYISETLTKGSKEYLLAAEKAGLITGRLHETHIQPSEELLKNPGLYFEAGREPKLFEKYTELVQPQVIGHRESYPMKPFEVKPKEEKLPFKPMKPIGEIKESKGGAGSSGKAKALSESIHETEKKPFTKTELFKTEKPLSKSLQEHPFFAASTYSSIESLAYPKGTEEKLTGSYKTSNNILTEKLETAQNQRHLEGIDNLQKNVSDLLNIKETKNTNKTDFITTTRINQDSILTNITSTKTSELQLTKQVTKQTTTEKLISNPKENPLENPRSVEIIPPILGNEKPITEKKKKGSKVIYDFLGAASAADIVGLTGRADITTGQKRTASLLQGDIRRAEKGEKLSFNISHKLLKNKPTNLRANKIKPPKIVKKGKTPKF